MPTASVTHDEDRRAPARRKARAAIALWSALAALAVVLLFVFPIFRHPGYCGVFDWDVHFFYHEIPRLTVARFHQFPLWDPYWCGGMPMLAHPESRFLSPFFALYLALGTPLAAKVGVALHLWVALLGAALLARRAGASLLGCAFAGCVFALSGMFTVNLATGDFFAPAAYAPWALLFAFDGLQTGAERAACGATLALIFCEGGPVIVVLVAVLLAAYAAALAGVRRSWRPFTGLLIAGAIAAGLAAIKLVPALEFMRAHPRPAVDYSGFSVRSFADALVRLPEQAGRDRDMAGFWRGMSWHFDENGMYVGWVAAALGAAGLLLGGSELRALRAAMLVMVWLSFGDRIRPSLWALLHRLPVFSSMRVATRFRLGVMLPWALFCGAGLDELARRARGRLRRPELVAAALAVFVLADLWRADAPLWRRAFIVPPPSAERDAAFSQTAFGDEAVAVGERHDAFMAKATEDGGALISTTQYAAAAAGQGLLDCNSQVDVPSAALPRTSRRYRGEAFLDGAPGRAAYASWTPNRLELDVAASGPGWAVVNQNYAPGWVADDGRPVLSRGGLLAVPVSARDRRVALEYRPASFRLGTAATLLTLAGLAAWALAARRGKGREPDRRSRC